MLLLLYLLLLYLLVVEGRGEIAELVVELFVDLVVGALVQRWLIMGKMVRLRLRLIYSKA